MTDLASATRRYLALWFPYLPADRLRRSPHFGLAPETPLAFTEKVKGALRLAAVDQAARSLGLEPGMALADARARVPELEAVERDAAADRAWLERLADGSVRYTPMVALDRITGNLDGRILAKLDMLNPGFSKKDRAALQIIDDAEHNGSLKPGQTVVELTSGNMGTGLAIVCGNRGYPFVAVMSKGNSSERARMMRALGAEVVLVEQQPGSIPGEVSGDDLALVQDYDAVAEMRRLFHVVRG